MHFEAATARGPVSGDIEAVGGWSDAELLHRFLHGSEAMAEAAFAALTERHGPVVHRVCLGVIGDREGARDASQAVFLVLARKAGTIRKPGSIGPWLHGVALRVARRARGRDARRRAAERRTIEHARHRREAWDAPDPLVLEELHEEVDRLPETYRQPIVLCDLQGRTQAEAARALGWPLGTVQARLHRGRARLRSRLNRRGVGAIVPFGIGMAASPSDGADVASGDWSGGTVAAAVRFAIGEGAAGTTPPAVTRLAEAALAAMRPDPSRVVAAILTILLLLGSAAHLLIDGHSEGDGAVSNTPRGPASAVVGPRPIPPIAPPALASIGSGRLSGVAPIGEASAEPAAVELPEAAVDPGPSPGSPGESGEPSASEAQAGEPREHGRALFERVWEVGDPRGRGGDGLGPVFNGASCAACHHLGGPGGAGGVDGNIEIATLAELSAPASGFFYAFRMDFGAGRFDYRIGNAPEAPSGLGPEVDPRVLGAIHPGFVASRSVVLHRFGTDPAYNTWRGSVPGRHGTASVGISHRNPPALFGAGLIDAIPDGAIEAASRRRPPRSNPVRGRVGRLEDGRIGRFGWKAQTATLDEFVRGAAAGEIGLEVPGHRQAADPRLPGLVADGLDMDLDDCRALLEYVRGLPAPIAVDPADDRESSRLEAGRDAFKAIGCTHCHLPDLGGVEGIYSDLLLHDMSPRLGDSDAYSVFNGDPPRPVADRSIAGAATAREWRTPPLWGLRDSAPYLHDGRARNIDQAIGMHGGQGAFSARRYADLSPRRKQQLHAFLGSLAAPSADP